MKQVFITRRERFSASHKLFRNDWSDEKNLEVFGKCSNPNWHGHNYDLFVTVKGTINPETGFVADLSEIGNILKDKIIQHVDHKNLNLDVPFMKDKLASTENLAIAFWDEIEKEINALNCTLHCVKIQETENNYVEYFG